MNEEYEISSWVLIAGIQQGRCSIFKKFSGSEHPNLLLSNQIWIQKIDNLGLVKNGSS